MIFNSIIQSYQCPSCDTIYSKALPTSVIPMGMVIIAAAILWARTYSLLMSNYWLSGLSAIITSTVLLLIMLLFLDWHRSRIFNKGICMKCGSRLKAKFSGFTGGIFPDLTELFIYTIMLLLPYIVGMILKST